MDRHNALELFDLTGKRASWLDTGLSPGPATSHTSLNTRSAR
jgi:hypothetical protein